MTEVKNILTELTVLLHTVLPELPEDFSLTVESRLEEDLGLDFAGLTLFAVLVEDNYDIRFNGASGINTIGDMIEYISAEKGLVIKH